jgi:hypothetical protein
MIVNTKIDRSIEIKFSAYTFLMVLAISPIISFVKALIPKVIPDRLSCKIPAINPIIPDSNAECLKAKKISIMRRKSGFIPPIINMLPQTVCTTKHKITIPSQIIQYT